MRLFRRVPTPFAITYLVSSLLRESVQKRKADKYAAQAVHYYKPFANRSKKKETRAKRPRFSILRRRHEVVQLRLQPDDLSLRSIGAALGTLQRGVFV